MKRLEGIMYLGRMCILDCHEICSRSFSMNLETVILEIFDATEFVFTARFRTTLQNLLMIILHVSFEIRFTMEPSTTEGS